MIKKNCGHQTLVNYCQLLIDSLYASLQYIIDIMILLTLETRADLSEKGLGMLSGCTIMTLHPIRTVCRLGLICSIMRTGTGL